MLARTTSDIVKATLIFALAAIVIVTDHEHGGASHVPTSEEGFG
jgi:hypothetical protein